MNIILKKVFLFLKTFEEKKQKQKNYNKERMQWLFNRSQGFC